MLLLIMYSIIEYLCYYTDYDMLLLSMYVTVITLQKTILHSLVHLSFN